MAALEQVEKLRRYANVSFEEARDALEAADGNLLDAIVVLERAGKVNTSDVHTFGAVTALPGSEREWRGESDEEFRRRKAEYADKSKDLFKRVISLMVVLRDDASGRRFAIPVWLLVALLILPFWLAAPLLVMGGVIAWAGGYRFSFENAYGGGGIAGHDYVRAAGKAAKIFRDEVKSAEDAEKGEGAPEQL